MGFLHYSAFALLCLLGSTSLAISGEGFFETRHFSGDTSDLLESARGAAVLFESRGETGNYVPFANGFFISADGHILTNHHVGTNCGGRSPSREYQDRTRPLEYPVNRGYLCADFRARVFPNTRDEVVLRLEMLARPDQGTLDRGGDFIILHAIGYRPAAYVNIARTRDYPTGTPYFMVGYPPETNRGNSSELIRHGEYSDIKTRGEFRVADGETVARPDDYLNADNPVPYFVGNGDGAPGTSGSLVISHAGNFLGFVQGYADRRGIPGSALCLRDGKPAGSTDYYCGGLGNYLRATWILDRMDELFPKTVNAILLSR